LTSSACLSIIRVMTTSHRSGAFVRWALDLDGDLYGDERERLRWYEGIAIAATLQWTLVPMALAVMAWIAPREVAPYLWAMALVFVLPMFATSIYVSRNGVEQPRTIPRRYWVVTAATGVSFFAFIIGMTLGLDLRDPEPDQNIGRGLVGGLVGGFTGVVIAGALRVLWLRRKARKDAALAAEDA
jgi:hypothetical protein